MNIFILDESAILSAQAHIDVHCCKMIVEQLQLLCAAHHILNTPNKPDFLYKLTHENHPCAIFTRSCIENYHFVMVRTFALLQEYTHRYGKNHKATLVANWCAENIPTITQPIDLSIQLAMPDEHKVACPIESYRNYYFTKTHRLDGRVMMRYTNRKPPEWLLEKYKFEKVKNTWRYISE